MSERKVKVESMVSHTVVLTVPYLHFERVFSKELQSAKIDFDVMEEGLQDIGFRNFFTNGTLKVSEKQDRIDLGLEGADEDDYIEPIVTLSTGEIIKLLKSQDKEKIEEVLKNASTDLTNNIIKTALKYKIHDHIVVDCLKKYAPNGENIYDLIKLANEAEAPVTDEE